MSTAAKLDILIDIQAKLSELLRTREELKAAKNEARGLSEMLRQGLGIGTGMEIARRSIELVKGVLRESVGEAFRMASKLKDVSQNLSITTEALQVLSEHVKDNGGEFETLTQAIVNYNGVLAQVRTGNESAAKTFRDLGLSADELSRLPLELQMEKVAKAGGSFDQMVQMFGTRNAPKMMQSLRELADQGYGNLAKSMKAAGRVMQEDTIERLDEAMKMIERSRRAITIMVGDTIAAGEAISTSAKKNFIGTLWSGLRTAALGPASIGDFASVVALNQPAKKPADAPRGPKMASEEETRLAHILSLQQSIADVESNQLITEAEKRKQMIVLLGQQLGLYHEIEKTQFGDSTNLVVKAALGTLTEEELARYKSYIALLEKEAALRNQRAGLVSPKSDYQRTREGFGEFNKGNNPDGSRMLTGVGEGVGAGFMGWATQVGSVGQQVASTIQGTIGGAVSQLSQGIMGLIDGTKSFGETFADIGRMIVQQFIAMIIQALVFAAVIAVLDVITGGATSAALKLSSSFSGRDSGGEVTPGRPYIVGEGRPEVFIPSTAGRIAPNAQSFKRHEAGFGDSSPVGASKPRMFLMRPSTQQEFDALRRLPDWDVHVVDSVMRNRGTILNS